MRAARWRKAIATVLFADLSDIRDRPISSRIAPHVVEKIGRLSHAIRYRMRDHFSRKCLGLSRHVLPSGENHDVSRWRATHERVEISPPRLESRALFGAVGIAIVESRDALDGSAFVVKHGLDDMRGNAEPGHAAGGGAAKVVQTSNAPPRPSPCRNPTWRARSRRPPSCRLS